MFIGSISDIRPTLRITFTLVILFGCIAGAQYELGYNPTPEGIAYAGKLLKIGGGFGFVAMIMGWYVLAPLSLGPLLILAALFLGHRKSMH